MSNLIKHINKVAWRMLLTDCVLLSEGDETNFPEWRVYYKSIDANDPGFEQRKVGYYLQEYVGHTFETVSFGLNYIDVIDIFRVNVSPTVNCEGVYYESVFSGRAPVLAPIFRKYLDKVASEYSKSIEIDILWSNDPNPKRILFENTVEPKIENYQSIQLDGFILAEDFGENPKLRLLQIDEFNNLIERTEKPYFINIGGLIDSITFGVLPDAINCYIEISR